jgi:hypothetical protein
MGFDGCQQTLKWLAKMKVLFSSSGFDFVPMQVSPKRSVSKKNQKV